MSLATAGLLTSETRADTHVVFGKVLDKSNNPIPEGSVTVFDNELPLLNQKVAKISRGTFELRIAFDPGKELGHVMLEISAPGFERVTKTVRLDRPDISLSPITLRETAIFEIDSIVIADSADGARTYIDFMLHNRQTKPADVVKLRLIGAAEGTKSCFDGGAEIDISLSKLVTTFASKPQSAEGAVSISVPTRAATKSSSIKASGELQYRKCALSAVRFEMPYLIPFAADERLRLHLEVPKKFLLSSPPAEIQMKPVSLGIRAKESSGTRESFVEQKL